MKYIIVKTLDSQIIKLTRPATAKQAHRSFQGFKAIGLTDIQVIATNKISDLKKEIETSGDFLKAKKDFEAEL